MDVLVARRKWAVWVMLAPIRTSLNQNVMSVGSGSGYAQAAALALMENTDLSSEEIAMKALKIASELCIYTNDHIISKTIPANDTPIIH